MNSYVKFNIYTQDYEAIDLVEVRLISNGAPSSRYTDSNGYVSIEVLERKDIEVILIKNGFETKRHILNLQVTPNQPFTLFMERLNLNVDSSKSNSPNRISPSEPKTSEPPLTNNIGVAIVFDPPSNVRETPNGKILCSVREPATINIYGQQGQWYDTDVCGRGKRGLIHSSQIKF